MPKKKREAGHAIRIGADAFRKLKRLQVIAVSRGWSALAVESTQQPTLSAVMEQVIAAFAEGSWNKP